MLYFLHLSKSAGSTFVDIARRNAILFRPHRNGNPTNPISGDRFQFWRWSSEEQAYFLSSKAFNLVANETTLGSNFTFFSGVEYLVILRDPLDRALSDFQFRNRDKITDQMSPDDRASAFADFIEKNPSERWINNFAVQALTYRYKLETEAAPLQLARERLSQFDHIFFVDTLNDDIGQLANIGWRFLGPQWKKARGAGDVAKQWSNARTLLKGHPKTLAWLEEANAADLELYRFAKNLIAGRKETGPTLASRAAPEAARPQPTNPEFQLFLAYEAFLNGKFEEAFGELTAAAETLGKNPARFAENAIRRFNAEALLNVSKSSE